MCSFFAVLLTLHSAFIMHGLPWPCSRILFAASLKIISMSQTFCSSSLTFCPIFPWQFYSLSMAFWPSFQWNLKLVQCSCIHLVRYSTHSSVFTLSLTFQNINDIKFTVPCLSNSNSVILFAVLNWHSVYLPCYYCGVFLMCQTFCSVSVTSC